MFDARSLLRVESARTRISAQEFIAKRRDSGEEIQALNAGALDKSWHCNLSALRWNEERLSRMKWV
jgi:HAMP domain-containing protein